jgi:predicted nucleic acid-binding protein
MFLLDTNVISELRRSKPHGGLLAWIEAVPTGDLSVPAAVVGEIARGIELARVTNPRKATELSTWLDALMKDFEILPATGAIFRLWGQLMHRRQAHLAIDALIAATALHHGLTVATRNVDDFTPFGVLVANPFGRAR